MSAACMRPDLHLLLGRYEFDGLDLEERHAVEAHVLDCDACFAELERGARAVAAMREHAGDLRRVLAEPGPAEVPQAVAIGAWRPRWRSWRLAPVALAAVVAGIALVRVFRAPNMAELASFPTETLAPEILRSPVQRDAARELLATGAAHFDLGHYDEAAQRFRAALEHEPTLAEAAYWAGLSTALAGDALAAIPYAEKAVQFATGEGRPRAAWVLANAYLATGRTSDARRVLEELRAAGGPFGDRAGALLDRIDAQGRP